MKSWGRFFTAAKEDSESCRLPLQWSATGLGSWQRWTGQHHWVVIMPEGPDNCLKAVVDVVASAEAWTQGPLPPRMWAIKAIFSPLTCPASLQAVAIIRIIHLLQNLTNCHQNYSVQLEKLLQGPVRLKSPHWAMPEVDDNWQPLQKAFLWAVFCAGPQWKIFQRLARDMVIMMRC